jgi:hypothetical protein
MGIPWVSLPFTSSPARVRRRPGLPLVGREAAFLSIHLPGLRPLALGSTIVSAFPDDMEFGEEETGQ